MTPTLKTIAIKWLKKHGYDGLCNFDCACLINDLMPCDDKMSNECHAGYIINYTNKEKCPCGEGCSWHIQPKKPT